jgi:nucleoside-diphosphate-sugar epimerase
MKPDVNIIFEDARGVLFNISDFSFLRNKTVLVTGATGLLGTHILAVLTLLKESGMNIEVFGHYHSDPADYTRKIAARGKIRLMQGNTFESTDVVIHAIGYAQPVVFTANPAETIRINTTLTQTLLNWLRPGGKFLFVSSSEVYNGLDGQSMVSERSIGTTTPLHPRACYIEGKRCGEAIVNAYRQAGVDAKSIRLGMTYGPGTRAHDQRAMNTFIKQAMTTGKLELKYSGLESRAFCYVSDAVEIMFQVLLHGKQEVYNVGGGTRTSMKQIARKISEIIDVPLSVPMDFKEIIGAHAVDMNTSRVQNEFGKKDFVGLEEGLKRTIDWQRGFYESV